MTACANERVLTLLHLLLEAASRIAWVCAMTARSQPFAPRFSGGFHQWWGSDTSGKWHRRTLRNYNRVIYAQGLRQKCTKSIQVFFCCYLFLLMSRFDSLTFSNTLLYKSSLTRHQPSFSKDTRSAVTPLLALA